MKSKFIISSLIFFHFVRLILNNETGQNGSGLTDSVFILSLISNPAMLNGRVMPVNTEALPSHHAWPQESSSNRPQ